MYERDCGNCLKEDNCVSWDKSYRDCLSKGLRLWVGRYKCPKVAGICGFMMPNSDCALDGKCDKRIDKIKTIKGVEGKKVDVEKMKEMFK